MIIVTLKQIYRSSAAGVKGKWDFAGAWKRCWEKEEKKEPIELNYMTLGNRLFDINSIPQSQSQYILSHSVGK